MSRTRGHIPERTCIACRQKKPKRELIRIVRIPDSNVEVDHTGKESGRGAYLCKKRQCWELALKKDKKDRLRHALKVKISSEDRASLLEYAETFPINT